MDTEHIKKSIIIISAFIAIITFYFYITKKDKEYFENFTISSNCPNLLINKEGKFYMYNTTKNYVPGVNPIVFNDLQEYGLFTDWLSSVGVKCPILYAEQTYDTQGNNTYKIKPEPNNNTYNAYNGLPPVSTNNITKLVDAGHNKGSMPGFDPHNLYIGENTPLDKLFRQQESNNISDNPMDNNYGGEYYTKLMIKEGKYDGDKIYVKRK